MFHLTYTVAPDDEGRDSDDDIERKHPPRQPPRTFDGDVELALLIADGTIGTDSLHVQRIVAATQILELHAMQHGVTITPVVVASFHPIHKL